MPLIEKEGLIDPIILAGPLDTNKKYTYKNVIDFKNLVKEIRLESQKLQNNFLLCTIKLTTELLKIYQNLFKSHMKSWHKLGTKLAKADISIVGNKT